MAELGYKVDIDTSYWERRLANAETAASDLTGLHGAIGEVVVSAIRRNFDTSGDGQWAPLKPQTLINRAKSALGGKGVFKRGKGGKRTLTVGAVRAVASSKPLILSPAGLYGTLNYQAGPDHVDAGSNLAYAAHQFHGSKPEWRFNIPARNPLYLHAEDEREIGRMYEGYFAGPFQ